MQKLNKLKKRKWKKNAYIKWSFVELQSVLRNLN